MNNYLRIIWSVFLTVSFSFVYGQQIKPLKPIQKASFFQVKKIHPVALQAIRKGKKPASLKGVVVKFNSGVVNLQPQTRDILQKNLMENGIVPVNKLGHNQLQSNKIYLDPKTQTVFEVKNFSKDTLILTQPPIQKVLKEFKIPQQKVRLNIANTSYTPDNTKVTDQEKTNGDYLMNMEFDESLYKYEKEKKTKYGTQKIKVNITLTGYVRITNPELEVSYSANKGYYFTLYMKEETNLKVKSDFEAKAEFAFPIYAFDVPAGDYGNCKVGIYAFVDANGKVSLEYSIDQGLDVTAGMKGSTFFYAPRSYHPIVQINRHLESSYDINAEFKIFAGIQVVGDIKALKYDLAKLQVKAGPQFEAKLANKGKDFSAELGMRMLIDGNFKPIKKDFTIMDKYVQIWKMSKTNYGGYILEVRNADAYYDRVWGQIISEKDSTPYKNKNVKILVYHKQKKYTYHTVTDENGIFAKTDVPLVKGDMVSIKIADSPNESSKIAASIPFNNIKIYYADYTSDIVEGGIASQLNYFPKTSETVTQANGVNNNKTGIGRVNPVGIKVDKKLFEIHIPISQEMFENAVTYKGDVEVIVEPLVKQYDTKISVPKIEGKKQHTKRKPQGKGVHRFDKKIIAIDVIKKKKKVHNLPFGNFKVENLDIKPWDRVKVRVNIDGFVLESNWVTSDGIILTPSYDINKQGSIKTRTIKADDAIVVFNAFRSNKKLTGKVRLIKGIDMKHNHPAGLLPTQHYTYPKIPEFRQAVHPLIYYNKTVSLQPDKDNSKLSIAHTGPWQVQNIYYDTKYIVDAWKPFDGHRFEYIEYEYEGRKIYFKYYQKKCRVEMSKRGKVNKNNVPKNSKLGNTKIKKIGF